MRPLDSNMAYNREGGDVLGIEVFIVHSNRGYFAVYQSSEGEPAPPVVIPVKLTGTSVSFEVPPSVDARGNFTGTIDAKGLAGSFSGSGEKVRLERKASYWQ